MLFLEQARASLAQVALAIDVGRRAGRGEVGRVEIGYVGSAALAGVLQEQIFRFRAAWPDVQLRAKEVAMMTLPSHIVEGKIDVGLIRLPMTLPDGLSAHVLDAQPFCLALPVQHRLADASHPVAPVDLRSDRFVMPEQSLGTREVGHRGGFEPTMCSAPGNLLEVLTEVSMGIGISIVPDVVRGTLVLPGVIFKELEGKPIISEIAAVYRSDERAPAIRNLIQQLVDQGRQNA